MNPSTALPFLSCAISFGLLAWLLRAGSAGKLALDYPNDRSLHTQPVPRMGGLGIVAGVLIAALSLGQPYLAGLVLFLAAVSWIDDRGHVPIPIRLGVQVIAAVAWIAVEVPESGLLAAIAVPALVWMTNLYNFMDGSDGLAGGMALIGFTTYGIAAWLADSFALALLGFSIATAAGGFLYFNFPPARMFMGDVGSVPLGFLAGAIGLLGWQQKAWPLAFPILVFLPFIVDATVTLLRRIVRGQKFWQAHHDHFYQRLVRMGWGHRKLALCEYALMAAACASALAALGRGIAVQLAILGAWSMVCLLLMATVDRRWHRFAQDENAA